VHTALILAAIIGGLVAAYNFFITCYFFSSPIPEMQGISVIR
jgi:hypothetical protein